MGHFFWSKKHFFDFFQKRPLLNFFNIFSKFSDFSCNFTLTLNCKLKKYAQGQKLLIFAVFFLKN